ncbi:MAG TPA: glycosyltransferase, partial [Anaerolineaceae bacterium]|nr:glycosyltransferase [Anaerolineaceae bacterium]
MISIFLNSYNHEKFLRESIDSILGQTFTDYELIIKDDAST